MKRHTVLGAQSFRNEAGSRSLSFIRTAAEMMETHHVAKDGLTDLGIDIGELEDMVISNFRPYQVYFTFYYDIRDILLHNYDGVILNDHVFTLRPYECFLLKVR